MIIIGEKINGTRTAVAQAIQARDEGFIENLALQQTSAGAHYLDVNAETTGPPPESKLENVDAMTEAVFEYGKN